MSVFYYQCVANIFKSFESMPISTIDEKIKLILNRLCTENLATLPDPQQNVKSAKTSQAFKAQGLKNFDPIHGSQMEEAFEDFTKAMAFAPLGSLELSQAYLNRSAVLFRARMIKGCLAEIDKVFENGYPDNLKAKLYLSKAICYQALDYPMEQINAVFSKCWRWLLKTDQDKRKDVARMILYHYEKNFNDYSLFDLPINTDPLPELKRKNQMLPGTSDAVGLKYSEKYGRHIVARRDIKPGETLMVLKPYAKFIYLHQKYRHCWHCGEQTWTSMPCKRCPEVVYCSDTCRDKSFREYHDYECPILGTMLAAGWHMHIDFFISLRIVIRAHKEVNGSILSLKEKIEILDATRDPLKRGFTDNVFDSSSLTSFYSLTTNYDKLSMPKKIRRMSCSVLVAYYLAIKTDFFGVQMTRDLAVLKEDERFIFIVKMLFRSIHISRINISSQRSYSFEKLGKRISVLIAPVLSLLNHSCNQNTLRYHSQGHEIVKARYPIKKGEQLFNDYGMNCFMTDWQHRQAGLAEHFYFTCDCEACVEDWPKDPISAYGPDITPSFLRQAELLCGIKENLKDLDKRQNVYCPRQEIRKNIDFSIMIECLVELIEFFHFYGPGNSDHLYTANQCLKICLQFNEKHHLSLETTPLSS